MKKYIKGQVKEYYSKKQVVDTYDKVRFNTPGSNFVNHSELSKIRKLIKFSNGSKVLDAGAGTGRLSKYLIQQGYAVTALDSSKEMIDTLKKISKLKVSYGSVFLTPFNNEEFDKVLSLRVVFHFNRDDLFKILEEYSRITKNGGEIIFDTLNPKSLGRIASLLSRTNYLNYYINPREIEKHIKEMGYNVDKLYYFFIPHGVFIHSPRLSLNFLIWLEKVFSKSYLKMFGSSIYWRIYK